MATGFIDLGYYGGIFMRDVGGARNTALEDAFATEWRNRIVAAGKLDDTNLWGVSPVGKWTGSGYNAYGIRIEHRVAGTPTGVAWLLTWAGSNSSNTFAAADDVMGPGVSAYYQTTTFGALTSQGGFLALHMITDSTVSDYDWGVVSAFDPPTSNPDTQTATFYPAGELRGHVNALDMDATGASSNATKNIILFDHDEPFLAIYSGNASNLGYFSYAGDLLEPTASGDTNGYATYGHGYNGALGASGTFSVSAFDAAGTAQTDWTFAPVDYLSWENAQAADYTYVRTPLNVYRSTEVKGTFKRDLFFSAGGSTRQNGLRITTPRGCAIKYREDYLLPWVTDLPYFPFDFPLSPTLIPR